MKKITAALLSVIPALLFSCSNDVGSEACIPEGETGTVRVEFHFTPVDQRVLSRATDENAIRKLTVALTRDDGFAFMQEVTGDKLSMELEEGTYQVYAIANQDVNIQEVNWLNLNQMNTMTVNSDVKPDDIPMSCRSTSTKIAYPAGGGTVVVPVELVRVFAKVNFNVSVADDLREDIKIKSVWLSDVRAYSRIFPQEGADGLGIPFKSFCVADTPQGTSFVSGSAYVTENLKGEVPSILTQADKNHHNAPEDATYINIRADYKGQSLDYCVFLGENNTSNFNVWRNTASTYNITITGTDRTDTRIHDYEASFGTSTVGFNYPYLVSYTYCSIIAYIATGSPERVYDFNISSEVLEGDGSHVFIEGQNIDGASIDFNNGVFQQTFFRITTDFTYIQPGQEKLKLRFTLKDQYDGVTSWEYEFTMINSLYVYHTTNGSVSALNGIKAWSGMIDQFGYYNIVFCNPDSEIMAQPFSGYVFKGWYKDPEFTDLLSTEHTIRYSPTSCLDKLFMKIEPE